MLPSPLLRLVGSCFSVRVFAQDPATFHLLQVLLPPTPLLSAPLTHVPLPTSESPTRPRLTCSSNDSLRLWQTAYEEQSAASSTGRGGATQDVLSAGDPRAASRERAAELQTVEAVDDLRWLLQFSHIDLKLAEQDDTASQQLPGTASDLANAEAAAVLPFEESCSKKIRLEVTLAEGKRCSR